MTLNAIDGKVYAPVGYCIYCGSTENLQKEHIIPLGLSGTAVLPKSSCPQCARITGNQEQVVLRGPLWAVRVYRDLHSRTKHRDAPKEYPLTIERNDIEEVISLNANEYPILLHFPVFTAPALINPEGYTSGIRLDGIATVSFGIEPEDVARKLGATALSITQKNDPVSFARVIAKIAYSTAFAEGALAGVSDTEAILPAILGETDNIGKWVGTLPGQAEKFDGHLHRVTLHRDIMAGFLIAEVHLFSDSSAPRYGVILGTLEMQAF
ncbi:HNH endonuclease [Geomonas subterranea]|uniref:HNH endonuclease n=1 Tax=Geomonas subterranea TaxID=2847989 RepID=A0ABX8LHX2_9BACT|nr:HNH endonuclease [Geomonas subterranea]QXE91641.1 HNH endonuclease [Geomonas subterranea]QXM10267.1 HNH endonuclease [Geomonas subterranea]